MEKHEPPLAGGPGSIRDFALAVLEQLGAQITPGDAGTRVELDPAQFERLEGQPWWPAGPDADPSQRITLYLAFDPDSARADDRAELVTPGSCRLEQLVSLALREGRLGRAWVRMPGVRPRTYRPYLLFHFLLRCVGHQPRENLASVAVDLVSGYALPWPARPGPWRLAADGGGAPAESPRLSLGEAHQRAVDALARALAATERAWLAAARAWLERELDSLYAYVRAALAQDGETGVAAGPKTRLEELQTMARPHVRARAEAATLLYMPLVRRGPGDDALHNPVLHLPVAPAATGPTGPPEAGSP